MQAKSLKTIKVTRSTTYFCLFLIILIFSARLFTLMSGGSSIPFWDQWGGENSIFTAFENGTLSLKEMLAAHNEHRIFWTRLLTLALYEINGQQWDNQVESFASNLIYCLALAIPVAVASTNCGSHQKISVAASIILMGTLPFGWENTLVGFQSQFYINSLLAFTAIAVVSFGGIGYRTVVLLSLLILGSFVSMANGVLTAFACAGLLICRGVVQPSLFRRGLALAVFATFLGIAGFIATPSPSHHTALKAQDFFEFIHALWITSSWPLPPGLGQLVLLIPAAFWMTIIGRDRQSSADYFFLGLNALGMLNAVAIAYSRGHDLIEVTSRYTDTVLPSSIATIYFASRLVCSGVRGATTRFIAYGSYLTIFLAIIGQSYLQWSKLEERAYMLRMSTVNTAKFLNGDEEAFRNKPNGHVPYPDPAQLGKSLRSSEQSASLPTAVLGARALSGRYPYKTGRCQVITRQKDHFSTISVNCSGRSSVSPEDISIATGRLSSFLMLLRQEADLTVFPRGKPTSAPKLTGNSCAIDAVNEQPSNQLPIASSSDIPIRLSGWTTPAHFNFSKISWPSLKIILSNNAQSYLFDAGHLRTRRTDVANFLKNKRYVFSGFDAYIDTRDVNFGKYRVILNNGSSSFCDTGHDVIISAPTIPFVRF
ncbi:hypothetical protein [Xanthomonas melonis]|uniref:hypothetical protein n=1 Tax=Xanthomonas melonis TaxID=56456 RepID=UPI0011B068E1|nr:hypothetical protein [Xanthomonas melonis]MCC4599005.1 hypothetical protein [Xanthomonas melonis]